MDRQRYNHSALIAKGAPIALVYASAFLFLLLLIAMIQWAAPENIAIPFVVSIAGIVGGGLILLALNLLKRANDHY